jgi:glycosyltransferase involved in cell wall biosynthesis
MTQLSLVIVAMNEERTIGKVLEAARGLADEIILVDSGSTDTTKQIATKYGAKVFEQKWLGYAGQKNFALGLATGDWLLSLDADEVLTPELKDEIKQVLADGSCTEYDGFKIPRILYIGDRPVMHSGFYPDAQLRLIKNGAGLFNDRLVHEAIKVRGKVRQLCHPMNHYSYVDVAQFQRAMDKYARLSAKEYLKNNEKKRSATQFEEVVHPLWTFFYRFFIRQGFLDGKLGFELCLHYSNYVAKKIRYLRELQQQPQPPDQQQQPQP